MLFSSDFGTYSSKVTSMCGRLDSKVALLCASQEPIMRMCISNSRVFNAPINSPTGYCAASVPAYKRVNFCGRDAWILAKSSGSKPLVKVCTLPFGNSPFFSYRELQLGLTLIRESQLEKTFRSNRLSYHRVIAVG